MALAPQKRRRATGEGADRQPETRDWLSFIKRNSLGEVVTRDQQAIDTFIASLKSDGTWSALDYISYRQLGNQAISLLSLKNPEFVTWAARGDPMFAPYRGFKGTGVATTGPDLLCGKAPSELVNFSQNAASMGVMCTGGTTTGNVFSTTDGASVSGFGLALSGSSGGVNQNMRLNNSSVWTVPFGSHEGFGIGTRNGATLNAYRNGALIGTTSSFASIAPATAKMSLLSSFTVREDGCVILDFVGGLLTDAQVANLSQAAVTLRGTLGLI